jgi:hypothetical protein
VHKVSLVFTRQLRRFLSRNFVPVVLGLSLLFLTAGQAAAQYGGGGGTGGSGNGTYVPPKGGYSSATGAAIGAGAAAGAGALFLALHYHGRVTGCVQPGANGLRLLDDKNSKSYALVPGDVSLKPGQRVLLKGKRSKGDADTQTFTAKKLIKDLGSCDASLAASSSNSASK